MKLMKICTSKTNFTNAKSFSEIAPDSLFSKFAQCVHDKMVCNFLAKKIKTWFNDKTEKDFSFRIRGN